MLQAPELKPSQTPEERGLGEESARASAFFFEKIGGYLKSETSK